MKNFIYRQHFINESLNFEIVQRVVTFFPGKSDFKEISSCYRIYTFSMNEKYFFPENE